jgi:hypothetical protein
MLLAGLKVTFGNEEIPMKGLLRAAGFSLMVLFASCGVGAQTLHSHAAPAFTSTPADIQADSHN